MSNDVIQANYEALECIAARFGSESEVVGEMNSRIHQAMHALQNGGWEGEGSQAFFSEIEGTVFPTSTRLVEALAQAQTVMLQVISNLQTAEEEAAAPFKGNGFSDEVASGGNGISSNLGSATAVSFVPPAGFEMPEDPKDINEEYWDNLTEEEQKHLHYNRNKYQNSAGIPQQESDLVPGEWKSEGEAIAHNVGKNVSGNTDYRGIGPRAGQQAVYDSNGHLVTTSENKGTFDFVTPEDSLWGHFQTDVIPWIKWGNSPDDTTTRAERMQAFALGIGSKLQDMAGDAIDSTVDKAQDAINYVQEKVSDLF